MKVRITGFKEPPLLSAPKRLEYDWMRPTEKDAELLSRGLDEADSHTLARLLHSLHALGLQYDERHVKTVVASIPGDRRGQNPVGLLTKYYCLEEMGRPQKIPEEDAEAMRRHVFSDPDGFQAIVRYHQMAALGQPVALDDETRRVFPEVVGHARADGNGMMLARAMYHLKGLGLEAKPTAEDLILFRDDIERHRMAGSRDFLSSMLLYVNGLMPGREDVRQESVPPLKRFKA